VKTTRIDTIAMTIIALLICITQVQAQSKPWPQERPIQLHVGQQAGYAPDIATRLLADALAKELGQTVVVINKPAAGGRNMMNDLRKMPADGYVFSNVFWHMMATWPALFSNLEFNPAEDFSYVGVWSGAPQVVVTHPQSGIANWQQAIQQSRTEKLPMQYGTYGVVSPGSIYMAYAVKQAGARMEPVNFRGADGPLAISRRDVPLLIGGAVDVMEQIKAGSMLPIAISGKERLAVLPNVPTFAELGVQGLEAGIWAGLIAPPGLPKDIAEKMNAAVRRAVMQPEHLAKMTAATRTPLFTPGPEMQAQIRREIEQWSRVIREAGIKVQ
jgi:tripartite-type tricarboxylate transporter receptor subunit TctC